LASSCTPRKQKNLVDPPRSNGFHLVPYEALPTQNSKITCVEHPAYKGQRSQINIVIIFGYKDTRPSRFVADLFEKNSLINQFIRPCAPSNLEGACGFRSISDSVSTFTKVLGQGAEARTVNLKILSSAIGPDDAANRLLPEQKNHSKNIEKEFHLALTQSDAIFYIGHSRDGGGPDFSPPKLTRDEHVDYPFYTRDKKDLNKMLGSLKKRSKNHPLLLGIMSCSSSEHFAAQLKETFKDLTLISSRILIYYTDALANTYRSVDAYLRRECANEFSKRLRSQFSKNPSAIKIEGLLESPLKGKSKKPSQNKSTN